MKKSDQTILIIVLIILVIVQFYLIFSMKNELKQLRCDLGKAFFAEREYVYPILRAQGYNPDDYGKGIDNPITIDYFKDCKE